MYLHLLKHWCLLRYLRWLRHLYLLRCLHLSMHSYLLRYLRWLRHLYLPMYLHLLTR